MATSWSLDQGDVYLSCAEAVSAGLEEQIAAGVAVVD
jgi:hypothetical protein